MNNTRSALAAYLDRVGLLTADPLGEPNAAPSHTDNEFLVARMRDTGRLNATLLLIATGMLVLMFLLALFLVIYYRDHPSTIAYIFGGSFLSLLILVRWQRQLWIDKNTTDLFRRAAETLPAPELATMAMNYYNLIVSTAPRTRGSGTRSTSTG